MTWDWALLCQKCKIWSMMDMLYWWLPGNAELKGKIFPWWHHQMETFSTLLALFAGNSLVTGEFPSWRPVRRSFDVFIDLHPKRWLSKQWRRQWFEKPTCSLWRHCDISFLPLWFRPVKSFKNLEDNIFKLILWIKIAAFRFEFLFSLFLRVQNNKPSTVS